MFMLLLLVSLFVCCCGLEYNQQPLPELSIVMVIIYNQLTKYARLSQQDSEIIEQPHDQMTVAISTFLPTYFIILATISLHNLT